MSTFNQWLIWGIFIVVVFGGLTLWRYLSATKKQKDYNRGILKGQKAAKEALKKAKEKSNLN